MANNQFLYPPSVNTYMPAFLQTAPCRIYFALTNFNDPSNITHLQLSLKYMSNNISALNKTIWPNETALLPIFEDTNLGYSDNRFYVEVKPYNSVVDYGDLETPIFSTGVIYQAQLRFSNIDPELGLIDPGASWFEDNMNSFSAWSTTCLIKGIPAPIVSMIGLQDTDTVFSMTYDNLNLTANTYDEIMLNSQNNMSAENIDSGGILLYYPVNNQFSGISNTNGEIAFAGQYINSDMTEPLKSYRLRLFDSNNNLLEDSGTQFPNKIYNGSSVNRYEDTLLDYLPKAVYSDFNYRLKVFLANDDGYQLILDGLTKNGYVINKQYNFSVNFSDSINRSFSISRGLDSITIDIDNGRVGFSSVPLAATIKRASHKTQFMLLDNISKQNLTTVSDNIFYDYTAEGGVFYKYWADGNLITEDPIMIIYEDIFLLGQNRQLRVQLDPKISSFKYTVADSKTDTLGGTYPFIRRNGNMRYKELSISGLISAEDTNFSVNGMVGGLFSTETELYQGAEALYSSYNSANLMNRYDVVREKEYRNKVLDFLYDGEVKLYKSTEEGNILVKVMEVSLTPTDSLNRLLYSFSATLTEIDGYSISNCQKYNIANLEVI